MKRITLICLSILAMSFTVWQTNFEAAKQTAKDKHQLILLNFSGSDWCGPCIRMRREIFENRSFISMADTSLVLVNADFPRSKKNQPDKKLVVQNEALADQYNPEGKFPFTLLLDANGKVLKTWDGLPKENAAQFAALLKTICNAHK
jgi:thioredoxin-related protein